MGHSRKKFYSLIMRHKFSARSRMEERSVNIGEESSMRWMTAYLWKFMQNVFLRGRVRKLLKRLYIGSEYAPFYHNFYRSDCAWCADACFCGTFTDIAKCLTSCLRRKTADTADGRSSKHRNRMAVVKL